MVKTYSVQAARSAQASGYGGESYWDYLEQAGRESYDYYMRHGDPELAEQMLTRSLGEALCERRSHTEILPYDLP